MIVCRPHRALIQENLATPRFVVVYLLLQMFIFEICCHARNCDGCPPFIVQRSYNIGMDAKGQGCLKEIGAWERIEPHCAEVVGRVDFLPGGDKPQEVDFIAKFGYPIKVIQRDCLTALLREEIEVKYSHKIKINYNTECKSIQWGKGANDPVKLTFQNTRRVFRAGEVHGARPAVEPVGEPLYVVADFVVGADGSSSRVRDSIERCLKCRYFPHVSENSPCSQKKKWTLAYLVLLISAAHHSWILPSYLLLGDLPKRHMWGVLHISFIGFSKLNIVLT
jgi:hypothetical protein